tara:strand:+ start:2082 stop:2291 length:210 start_codon:yes stop_codon:yes gene_type:complete
MDNNDEKKNLEQLSTEQKEVLLNDIVVKDPSTALNVLVSFVNLANKRGAFTIQESAKIWECVLFFQKKE